MDSGELPTQAEAAAFEALIMIDKNIRPLRDQKRQSALFLRYQTTNDRAFSNVGQVFSLRRASARLPRSAGPSIFLLYAEFSRRHHAKSSVEPLDAAILRVSARPMYSTYSNGIIDVRISVLSGKDRRGASWQPGS